MTRTHALTVALAVALGAASGGTTPASRASAGTAGPRPVAIVGFSAHGGLYGWGAATMPGGSVIIGDYLNHRVVHYDTAGNYLGVIVTLPIAPASGSIAYGLAVDNSSGPNQGDIYVGLECCAVEKFALTAGRYVLSSKLTAPGFVYPANVAVDRNGNVYVCDMLAAKIFRFDTAGGYLGSWGTKGSGSEQFNQPRAIALDNATPTQSLYVLDAVNQRIDVVSTGGANAGDFITTFGAGHLAINTRGVALDTSSVPGWVYVTDDTTGVIHQFYLNGSSQDAWYQDFGGPWIPNDGRHCCAPDGLFGNGGREAAVDGSGQLWVGDMPDFRVQVFSPSGTWLMSRPNPASPPVLGGFNAPHGVALDPGGNIVVTDTDNFRVEQFDASGTPQWQQGMRGVTAQPYALDYPSGVAVEPGSSALIVIDSYNGAVKKYDGSGNWVWTYSGVGSHALKRPEGVAVGPGGTMYVADTGNRRIAVLIDGGTSVAWSGTLGSGLTRPSGVAVDPSGNVFVSDFSAHDVIEFNSSGTTVSTIGGPTSGQPLKTPADVVVDGTGTYLYVSDTNANKVMIYRELDGSGAGVLGGSKGGGTAQFSSPIGLALSGTGNLYVADSGNDRISEWCVSSCA